MKLLVARETGLLRLGEVLSDGTNIDADASKYRSVRYDRIKALCEHLAVDIAELMEQVERTDIMDTDPQALPKERARLEADVREQAETARPAYEKKKAAYDAKTGCRGRAPKPPDEKLPPERQVSGRSA